MLSTSKVTAVIDGLNGSIIVQGFRGDEPYVFVGGLTFDDLDEHREFHLTPEEAHILGEELRKHAEFATTAATAAEGE